MNRAEAVKKLVAAQEVRISEHGYDEIAADGIYVRDVLAGVGEATFVEDYPASPKGRAVLVLQFDNDARPIQWGIPKAAGFGRGLLDLEEQIVVIAVKSGISYTFIAICYKRAYGLASVPVPLLLTAQYLAYL